MSSNNNYLGMFLEEIRDQNKAVLEAAGQIRDNVRTLATQSSLQEVANDIATIKVAVTATNHDLLALDSRVSSKQSRTGQLNG